MRDYRLLYWVIGIVAVVGLLSAGLDINEVGRRLAAVLGIGDKRVEMVAVGDVMLGRSVNATMYRKNDWTYPFGKVKGVLAGVDITFGNLEAPLVSGCRVTDQGMRFCADPRAVEGLILAGFDVMSLANNHIFNYGRSGFGETEEVVEENGIEGVGEGEVAVVEKRGIKIGVVAFDDVSKRVKVEDLEQVVGEAEEVVDVVVASVHWGAEYREKPTTRQRELARELVEAGVDVVLGHHPHWVEEVEEINGAYVFYSLGNFVFDQMWSDKTREGVIARIWLTKEGVDGYEMLPVKIYEYSQPRFEI